MDSTVAKPALDLICPADEIFDAVAFATGIDAAAKICSDNAEIRSAAVDLLREANANGRALIAEEFARRPFDARPMTSAYSFLMDGVVRSILYVAQTPPAPVADPNQK